MKRVLKFIFVAMGGVAIVVVGVAGWFLSKALPIGNGHAAKYICSSTFISGRPPETVFREEVKPIHPLFAMADVTVDRSNKTVTATALKVFQSTALYREGCGCTLIAGTTEEDLRDQSEIKTAFATSRPQRRSDNSWPLGSMGPQGAMPAGVDPQKLKTALDRAFAEGRTEPARRTRAVVVVFDGRLIAERYAPGFDVFMPLPGWSMSKSITNALVGILVKQGKLDIYSPAPVSEWQQEDDPRRRITLDMLLRMSSGLEFGEAYAPLADATDMLYGAYAFGAYAAAKSLESEPGTRWQYSSGTSNIIARIIRQTLEKNGDNVYAFMHRELFDKIGMYSAVMEPDPSGTFVGSSYTLATPRDWARFGLLYLQDGIWNGERILPEGWVQYTRTPTPNAPQGQYGAHFWLNAGTPSDPNDIKWPSIPRDTFFARGFQEQRVFIIPSKNVVLVRMGNTSDRSAWDDDGFVADVLAAIP